MVFLNSKPTPNKSAGDRLTNVRILAGNGERVDRVRQARLPEVIAGEGGSDPTLEGGSPLKVEKSITLVVGDGAISTTPRFVN